MLSQESPFLLFLCFSLTVVSDDRDVIRMELLDVYYFHSHKGLFVSGPVDRSLDHKWTQKGKSHMIQAEGKQSECVCA